MPAAVITTVLALEFDLDASFATSVVFFTTLLSPITLVRANRVFAALISRNAYPQPRIGRIFGRIRQDRRADVKDVRQDTRDADAKDLHADKKDRRQDVKDVKKDTRDIRHDRRQKRQDRRAASAK